MAKKAQMAARISASTDKLKNTVVVPRLHSHTMTGWVYVPASRGAAFQFILSLSRFSESKYAVLGWTSTGEFEISNTSGGATYFAVSPPFGEWFFVAQRVSGGGANDHAGFWISQTGVWNKRVRSGPAVDSSTLYAEFNNNDWDEWVDGLIADGAIYNVPLTDTEIWQVYRNGPKGMRGLMNHYSFDGNAKDSIGKDMDTVTGITYEPGPSFNQPKPQFSLTEVPEDTRHMTVKVPWTKQPPAGMPIDLSNPICRDLTTVITFDVANGLKNIIDPAGNMDLGLGTVEFTGSGMLVDDAADVRVDLPPSALGVGTTLDHDYTVFTIIDAHKTSAAAGTDQMICVCNLTGTVDHVLYFDDTGTNGRLSAFSLAGQVKPQPLTEPNFVAGNPESYGTTYVDSTGLCKVFINGGDLVPGGDQGSGTMAFAETISGTGLACFAHRASAVQFDGEAHLFLAWSRALTDEEYASIHNNPWQIFKPKEIMVPHDEALPKLTTFEKDVTSMPVRPPK
jgi:hypothetical protein